ncbi:sensor histidine kinase [Clostridium luticellarii]|uniref:Signal transduction histidine-protein kinase ArlS n=1 Tax=Clostridium luticellarii TaxID=1691940 RepID=A0A2T0B4H4_9CLOT|nr:ATP-binding protein [Clostridium luticellarii]PRR78677.1 Signal transduction histidine-protein kinase ArlS [Clostridium luticellarii]
MNLNIIKDAKISVKLTGIFAFMFSVMLVVSNAYILNGLKHYLYTQAGKRVEDVNAILLNKLKLNENSNNELFSDVMPNENMFIKIMDKNGKIISESNKFNYHLKISEPYGKTKHIEEHEKHLTYLNTKILNKNYGTVYIQIIKDMDNEYDFLKILFFFMAAADLFGIILSILLGYVISKKMLNPIDSITKTAEEISINNLKERIDIQGPNDELKRLAGTLNDMIDRLQGSFNRQVQFVSDASHELRTPIAIIQGYASLLDRWGKDDREALEKSIEAIKSESHNMGKLVEKLLFLARGDNKSQKIEKNRFHLNKLIDEVIEETRLIDKNHIISNTNNENIQVVADYKLIKQLVRIIVDNSVKFTAENGKIDISSIKFGKYINIVVSDTGIGIPQSEIPKIFDRFYCVDKSRSKDIGGSGLGLSIAKQIVDTYNGTVDVKSEEGKGTKTTISLDIDY